MQRDRGDGSVAGRGSEDAGDDDGVGSGGESGQEEEGGGGLDDRNGVPDRVPPAQESEPRDDDASDLEIWSQGFWFSAVFDAGSRRDLAV